MFLDLSFLKQPDGSLPREWVDLSKATFDGPVACDYETSLLCRKVNKGHTPSDRRKGIKLLSDLPEEQLQQEGVHRALLDALTDTSGIISVSGSGTQGIKNSHIAALQLGSLLESHSAATYPIFSHFIHSLTVDRYSPEAIRSGKVLLSAESALWALNAISPGEGNVPAYADRFGNEQARERLLKQCLDLTRPFEKSPTDESLRRSFAKLMLQRPDLAAPFEAALYTDAYRYWSEQTRYAGVFLSFVDLGTHLDGISSRSKQLAADGYELMLRVDPQTSLWFGNTLPWIHMQLEGKDGQFIERFKNDICDRLSQIPYERVPNYLDGVLGQVGLEGAAELAIRFFESGAKPYACGWLNSHFPAVGKALGDVHDAMLDGESVHQRLDFHRHAADFVAEPRVLDGYLLAVSHRSSNAPRLRIAGIEALKHRMAYGADPLQLERGVVLILMEHQIHPEVCASAESLLRALRLRHGISTIN